MFFGPDAEQAVANRTASLDQALAQVRDVLDHHEAAMAELARQAGAVNAAIKTVQGANTDVAAGAAELREGVQRMGRLMAEADEGWHTLLRRGLTMVVVSGVFMAVSVVVAVLMLTGVAR